ncbi:hypothetical protein [Mangrovimonas sp. TPBH4]|uniref:hypothetical protein n=1 Tax=Mangrovimonas sp. TPBH4 TaxID=1645914 RepID=UPI0006B558EA|nr:hypothetical protein [Mangrovimonas sp. TPBH4]
MKKATLVTLLVLLVFGCSKKQDEIIEEPNLETFELTTNQSTAKQLELVLIKSNEINFNDDSYIASFGDVEIDLYKTEDGNLIFSVPEINPGPRELELIIGNKIGTVAFSIEENTVQNPDMVIEEELVTPLNAFQSDLSELLLDDSFSLETKNQLSSAQQMIIDFLAKFNTISDEEKVEVAKFYNANPIFTTDFLNSASRNSMDGNSDYDCFKVNSQRVVLTTVTVLGFVTALPHLTAVGPFGSATALVGFVAGVYAAATIINAAREKLINDCFLPFEHALSDSFGNSNDFEVSNDSDYNFTITSEQRHIVASDSESSNTTVALTIEKLNLVKYKWETLKNGINSLITNTSNWFNNWFGNSSANYEGITYDFEDTPETSEELSSEGNSEFIYIEDFPSDVDVEYSVASDNSINLKFTADESTLPRTVTGIVKFDDGDFTTENEFSVTIGNSNIHPEWALGSWKLWTAQGFEEDLGDTGCFDLLTRTIDGQVWYFYYYPNGIDYIELFADGTVEFVGATNGCEDIPSETPSYSTWSVINNTLTIDLYWLDFELTNFTEDTTQYEFYSSPGAFYLNFFQR